MNETLKEDEDKIYGFSFGLDSFDDRGKCKKRINVHSPL